MQRLARPRSRPVLDGARLAAALLLGASAAIFSARPALASHGEPAKGKKATFALVNSYVPCDPPNTATSTGISACAPPTKEGLSLCALSPTGSGKLTLQVIGSLTQGTQDLKLSAVASGLNEFCENDQLCMELSFRAMTDDCPEGSCTTSDLIDVRPGAACCIVSGGKCKINTTLSAASGGSPLLLNGKNTGIELHGCGLKSFVAGALPPELTCGLLLK